VSQIDAGRGADWSFAIAQRRRSRREEFDTHVQLAGLLERHIDRKSAFWSSLENTPRSMVGGMFARRRGVKAGLPDLMVIARCLPPVFLEVKSKRGVASAAQRKIAAELVAAGCSWFLARSSRAAMVALHRAGVPLIKWTPPKSLLPAWEGPFDAAARRLPQHPQVAAARRAAQRRYRERQLAARETARLAAE
jgi:hypothetical protein